MPYTFKPSVLANYLIGFLTEKGALLPTPLQAVYYGDQQFIPKVPAVCVEPVRLERDYGGVPHRTENRFTVGLLAYVANVQGVEDAQRDADEIAEQIVQLVDQDGLPVARGGTNFGGLVVYGFVQTYEYGYVVKGNKLMRANRMIVEAYSKTGLLSEGA